MVVALVCGGGNGAHVLAGIGSAQPDTEIRILTLFADEAERWTNLMEGHEFSVTVHSSGQEPAQVVAKPSMVTKDPAKAADGVDLIVFVVPAFAHKGYLDALKPFVKPGVIVAGMPGAAGFDFAVRGAWGDFAKQCTIMSFESLPWAARITEFGRAAEVLGTKGSLLGAVQLGSVLPPADPTAMLQSTLGPLPKLHSAGHLLGITLMSTNAYLHPSIMYGRWHAWDGEPLPEAPLFYNGLDQASAATLSGASDEILAIAAGLMKLRPGVDLTNVEHIHNWYLRCYAEDITDKSTLYSSIQTNRAYTGLTHPTTTLEDGRHVPNYKYRYLFEDIPYGLAVMRGIAEVAGVETPIMNKIIAWAQRQMGKEYLRVCQLAGPDVAETRAPQAYGLTTVDTMLGLA